MFVVGFSHPLQWRRLWSIKWVGAERKVNGGGKDWKDEQKDNTLKPSFLHQPWYGMKSKKLTAVASASASSSGSSAIVCPITALPEAGS